MGGVMKHKGIKCDGYRMTKDGKLVKVIRYRDASQAMAARRSTKQKVARAQRP